MGLTTQQQERVCSIDGCDNPYLARGLCSKHYQRSTRGKDQFAPDGQIPCVVCGTLFMPYRKIISTCSRTCYRKLPHVVERESARKKLPHVKEIRNARRRVENNPHRREMNRQRNLARYGISVEQYDEMLEQQNGVCRICGQPPAKEGWKTVTRLHVDHDHETGKVRALLCNNCNRGLGYFQDSYELLKEAHKYLKEMKK